MTSPGSTGMAGTALPSGSVIVSDDVRSSLITRGLASVPGFAIGPVVAVAPPPEPPIWPLGLRQQAGTAVASGPGVKFGSRQPLTFSAVGFGPVAVSAWAGTYSNCVSELAVSQAMISCTCL